MIDEFKFKLNNFGPVNDADIDVSKITVVGGQNASGKSTSSKILYCFLKSNSSNSLELATDSLKIQILSLIRSCRMEMRENDNIIRFDTDAILNITRNLRNSNNLDEIIEIYEDFKFKLMKLDYNNLNSPIIKKKIKDIDESIELIYTPDYVYSSVMRKLLKSEFSLKKFSGFMSFTSLKKDIFSFNINFNKTSINSDESFFSHGIFSLNDVHYLDSFSFLDYYPSRLNRYLMNDRTGNIDHILLLSRALDESEDESELLFDEKINKNIIELEEEISHLIFGEFSNSRKGLTYVPENGEPCTLNNTASGIKQIGTIQLLLANRKLKEDSFLIIDEPEVNLHPKWQFKFAEILVLLVKKLNISIYINTHSPLFIESINAFSEFYDLEDYTNYYLTEKSDKPNKFNIYKVDSDKLHIIYNNLGQPYLDIDNVRLEKELE